MIEILNIFYLFIVIFLIFSFPLNNIFLTKKLNKYNYNIFEIYSYNLLLILSCLFILSFFKLRITIEKLPSSFFSIRSSCSLIGRRSVVIIMTPDMF